MLGVLQSGEGVVSSFPPHVYGVPVTGVITPVKENGAVVGVISCAISISNQVQIETAADNLNQNLSDTYASSNEISNSVMQLAEKMEMVKDHSVAIRHLVEETEESLKNIQGNSTRSNILALNASIEAARAREAGKGFSVVAEEMGRLAKKSGDATSEISQKLKEVFRQLDEIVEQIVTAADISNEQAANIEEISERLKEIEGDADMLAKAARINK